LGWIAHSEDREDHMSLLSRVCILLLVPTLAFGQTTKKSGNRATQREATKSEKTNSTARNDLNTIPVRVDANFAGTVRIFFDDVNRCRTGKSDSGRSEFLFTEPIIVDVNLKVSAR